MKRSKFTEAQIAFILRQVEEGTTVAEVCRKAGISQATLSGCRPNRMQATSGLSAEHKDRVVPFSRLHRNGRSYQDFFANPDSIEISHSEPYSKRR